MLHPNIIVHVENAVSLFSSRSVANIIDIIALTEL